MEIQDVDLDDQVNHGRVSETNSSVGGGMVSRIFHGITNIHVDFPRVNAYEEVVSTATNYPSLQDDIAKDMPHQMRPSIPKIDSIVNEKDKFCFDSGGAGETAHANYLYADDHKSIRIVKPADETDLMDNDIYERSGDMVAVESKTHEDKAITIVITADEMDLMDNDIYESGGGAVVVEHDTHE